MPDNYIGKEPNPNYNPKAWERIPWDELIDPRYISTSSNPLVTIWPTPPAPTKSNQNILDEQLDLMMSQHADDPMTVTFRAMQENKPTNQELEASLWLSTGLFSNMENVRWQLQSITRAMLWDQSWIFNATMPDWTPIDPRIKVAQYKANMNWYTQRTSQLMQMEAQYKSELKYLVDWAIQLQEAQNEKNKIALQYIKDIKDQEKRDWSIETDAEWNMYQVAPPLESELKEYMPKKEAYDIEKKLYEEEKAKYDEEKAKWFPVGNEPNPPEELETPWQKISLNMVKGGKWPNWADIENTAWLTWAEIEKSEPDILYDETYFKLQGDKLKQEAKEMWINKTDADVQKIMYDNAPSKMKIVMEIRKAIQENLDKLTPEEVEQYKNDLSKTWLSYNQILEIFKKAWFFDLYKQWFWWDPNVYDKLQEQENKWKPDTFDARINALSVTLEKERQDAKLKKEKK